MEGGGRAKKAAVLIHGLSEERSVWSRQARYFRESMDVVTYDVRGFGSSPVGSGDGTVGQMADDLAQVLSAHSVGRAWLLGFSMGGVIAQRFALDFPELVEGLVLIASSCTVGRAGQAFFRERLATAETGGLAAVSAINAGDARGCFATDDEALIAEYRRIRVNAVRDVRGYINAGTAMLRLASEPMVQRLGSISCPTLVMAGERDSYCPPRASEMIAGAIPGAMLEVIPGVGHCFHWEASELVNGRIRNFIESGHPLREAELQASHGR